jgi:hypothetical protein
MVSKFNASIKFILCLGWFKYVDFRNLDNDKARKTNTW